MRITRSLTIATVFALVGILLLGKDVGAQTKAPQPAQQDHSSHHQATEPPSDSTPQTSATQAERAGGMMGEEAAAAAKLDALVAKMNASTGESRTDAMAELLTVLVQQQKSMCERMMTSPGMMQMHEMMNMMQMHGMMDKKDDAK